jgi:hypothetical protein
MQVFTDRKKAKQEAKRQSNSTNSVRLVLGPRDWLEGTWEEIRGIVNLLPKPPQPTTSATQRAFRQRIEQAVAECRIAPAKDGVFTFDPYQLLTAEEMEAITEGTNMEGLTPNQAYALDQTIANAVGYAAKLGVSHERFLELCDAARDVAGFLDQLHESPKPAN